MSIVSVSGWGEFKSVKACLDNNRCQQMVRVSGETWTGCPEGTGSSIEFELVQQSSSGSEATTTCECPGAWPWAPRQQCACPGVRIEVTPLTTG